MTPWSEGINERGGATSLYRGSARAHGVVSTRVSVWHLTKVGAVVAILLTVGCATAHDIPSDLPCMRDQVRQHPFLKRLVARETAEEAERRNTVAGVPFGALNAAWLELKSRLRPDDQLWRFTRDPHAALQGALEGYVVLRGCEVVDRLVLVSD